MKIIKNFFWNVGYQVFVLIVPFITVPYVNRILGPTGVGINAFTNSVVQYFVLIGSLGIALYGSRGTAYVRDDPDKLTLYFWELAVVRVLCVGVAVIAYFAFALTADRYRVFYVAQSIALFAAAFDISWFFQGMENFRVTVLRGAIVKLLSLVLIFALVHRPQDTVLYIVIMAGSQLVGSLSIWPSLRGYLRPFPGWRALHLRQHLRPSFAMLIPTLAPQLYVQLNKTMLGLFIGVTASGFYENSDKIIKMLLAVVTATGTVMLPHVANNFVNGKHAAVKHSIETSMHVVLVMAFPLAFGVAAVSSTFTYYFFSAKFMPVAQLMTVESFVVIPISIASAVGVQYLLPTNQMKAYTTAIVLGSIVNVVLNIPLILMLGTMGAMIGTIISELVVTGYQVFSVRKQLSIKAMFREVWKYAVAGAIMYVVVRVLEDVFARSILALVIEVIVGMSVYLLGLLILRPKIVFSYVTDYMQRRHA